MRANTIIGAPLISREITDTFSGYLFAYNADLHDNSTLTNWSFFAGSANGPDVTGHKITPVIMDQTDPNDWVVTAIGETRQFWRPIILSASAGLQSQHARTQIDVWVV